jgi:hypothetical protein
MTAETAYWVRLFNRLESAVRRHIDAKAKTWADADDDQLAASYRAVLRDATKGSA